jgi:beta-galactosidase
MVGRFFLAHCIGLIAAALPQVTLSAEGRATLSLDADWRFQRGDPDGAEVHDFDDSSWRQLDVPHDWSIEGLFDEENPTGGAGGWLPAGVGWYRQHFTLPAEHEGRRVVVEFDGVMANSDVWINGAHLGHRPYGYVSFQYDMTDHVRFGNDQTNILAVRVDNSRQPASRWYTGAGIYRHVRLTITDPLHVAPWGLFVTTPLVDEETGAIVHVEADVANDSDRERTFTLQSRLVDVSGNVAATAETPVTLKANGNSKIEQDVTLQEPQLWEIDNPRMYRLESKLIAEDSVVDDVSTPFGIRTAEFKPETGFWLNGKNIRIKGVCLHHDGGAVGAAVPLAVWERRLKKLRELGVNAIRTSHNPVAPEFLGLCDRLGFLVMDEFFDCWTVGKNRHDYHRHFEEWHRRDMRDTISRDRNHPSIILYSAGNEIRDTPREEQAKRILKELVEICHETDPSRPVTQALFRPNVSHDYDNGLADMLDVIGTNYRDRELLAAWRDDPSRKIIGTEQSHERRTWLDCRDNPHHAGQFLWVGIDYLGESRRWPVTTFDAGLLDRTGHPHPRAFERQSWWSDEPMVRIFRRIAPTGDTPTDPGYEAVEWRRRQVLFPDWTPRDTAPHVENVEVYSNCNEVDLLLNGQSLGSKSLSSSARPRNWEVPFETGELKAVGRNGNQVVAEDVLRTAGAPTRIELNVERQELAPTWDDVATVCAQIVDDEGIPVPRADHVIRFSIVGPGKVVAVDNGSIVSHEPFQGTERKAFQGRAIAIVRATEAGGYIEVRATADDLAPGAVQLQTVTHNEAVR